MDGGKKKSDKDPILDSEFFAVSIHLQSAINWKEWQVLEGLDIQKIKHSPLLLMFALWIMYFDLET